MHDALIQAQFCYSRQAATGSSNVASKDILYRRLCEDKETRQLQDSFIITGDFFSTLEAYLGERELEEKDFRACSLLYSAARNNFSVLNNIYLALGEKPKYLKITILYLLADTDYSSVYRQEEDFVFNMIKSSDLELQEAALDVLLSWEKFYNISALRNLSILDNDNAGLLKEFLSYQERKNGE